MSWDWATEIEAAPPVIPVLDDELDPAPVGTDGAVLYVKDDTKGFIGPPGGVRNPDGAKPG